MRQGHRRLQETKPGIESKDLEKLARSIVDTLGSEFYTKVVVGIGTSIVGVKDLQAGKPAYSCAQTACARFPKR